MLIYILIFSCNFSLLHRTLFFFSHFQPGYFEAFKDLTCSGMNLDEVFIIFGLTLIKNYNSVVSSLKWRCDGMYFIGSMWMLNVIMYIDGLWQLLAHRNKSIYITGYIVILVTILSLVKISHYHMIPFCKNIFWKITT